MSAPAWRGAPQACQGARTDPDHGRRQEAAEGLRIKEEARSRSSEKTVFKIPKLVEKCLELKRYLFL